MTRRLSLLVAVLLILAWVVSATAHEEPSKTAAELTEDAEERAQMSRLGIAAQEVWVIKAETGDDSTRWYENRYDRDGNLVEQVVFGDVGQSRSVSLYDHNGAWFEEMSYRGDSLEDRTVFVYNEDGLIRRIASHDRRGDVMGRLDYDYLPDDGLIAATKHGSGDSLQYTLVYRYEPGGTYRQQLGAVKSDADGSQIMRVANLFGGDLRSRKDVFGPDDELLYWFTYTYTADREFEEIVKRLPGDTVALIQRYVYDEDGLIASVTETDADGAVLRTIYYRYRHFE